MTTKKRTGRGKATRAKTDTRDTTTTASRVKATKQKTFYGAGTLKRIRRTAAQTKQLDSQIIEVLTDDHPQSVRHIFYRMTDPRLPEPVDKSDRGYRHVQSRCVALRRSGELPYGYFADLSRRGYFVSTFSDASDFVTRMSGLYRADLWRDADVRCEVWAESRSIASVILSDCKELAVDLYPCGGFSSLSFVHEAAESLNDSGDARPVQIFYVGDYDAAGVLIDVSLQRELREHLRTDIDLTPLLVRAACRPARPRCRCGRAVRRCRHAKNECP